jgi:hypothetical protein
VKARLLEFDPTPAGLVTRPLNKTYKSVWLSLRTALLKEHGAVCQICKHVAEAKRHIKCHEVYIFPDKKVVRLERVALLCWRCHDAVHFERTVHRCGQAYIDEIAAHYCTVNGGITKRAFDEDAERTFRCMLAIRSSYGGPGAAPPIDYGPYQIHVDEYLKRKWQRLENDDEDEEYEMLPDHECPWDTAMWRECFV